MHTIPQISTLFPYTTLFRSLRLLTSRLRCGKGLRYIGGRGTEPFALALRRRDHRRARRQTERLVEDIDRKSTRLNSSHTVISYAVLCLKKKIKNMNEVI